ANRKHALEVAREFQLQVPAGQEEEFVQMYWRERVAIDQALREFHRVLRPGGRLCILEFSPNVARPLQPLYRRYCFTLLPALGKYVARDEAAYRYLAESIQQFPTQTNLAKRLTQAGFGQVSWLNFSGGICAMHEGWRI
ncbi:MAG: hypothetical protein EBV03_13865, partial [Proteobacteria bacterium]|nr:hypothetical protein [Pseudomonadota bacterium]